MRKLIRHKESKAFLTGSGDWSSEARGARDFLGTGYESVVSSLRLRSPVEWYYSFDEYDHRWDFTIAIPPLTGC